MFRLWVQNRGRGNVQGRRSLCLPHAPLLAAFLLLLSPDPCKPDPANQTSASAQAPGRSFCHCLPTGATIPRVSGAAETAGVGSGHPCCLAFEHEAAVPLDRKDYLSFSSPGQSQQEPHGLCCRNLERGKLWHEPVATLRQGVAGALPTPRSPGASLVSRPF